MSEAIHTNAPEVLALIKRAFADYNGKRVTVEVFQGPMTLHSYWSGGSRDYWAFVVMGHNGAQVGRVPENGTPWAPPLGELPSLPAGVALVQWTRGPHESVRVYVNPDNMNHLALPAPCELGIDEKIVLTATRELKNSYGGRTNIRFTEANEYTGITPDRWAAAQKALQSAGFLNHAFALTDKGRNAAGTKQLWALGNELKQAAGGTL